MNTPPPDERYSTFEQVSKPIFLMTLGMTGEATVEVLATDREKWYRFSLPTRSKVVRLFWRDIGVKRDADREWVGIRVHPGEGCGPFTMTGLAIGEDANGTVVIDAPDVR